MKRVIPLVVFCLAFSRLTAQQFEWQKCYGGSGFDGCESVHQTKDGGYVAAGYTESVDGDVTINHGKADFWVVKTDPMGVLTWQRSLGGSSGDWARSVTETDGGNIVVAGYMVSIDGDVSCNHGLQDFWVTKLDSAGGLLWDRCYGGAFDDEARVVRETPDGGLILAGSTLSNNGDVSGNHGWFDVWVVKTDRGGVIQWQKCYGGTENEKAFALDLCPDGGYVVAGHAWSNDGDVSGNHGGIDSWVIRIDSTGNLLWQRCLGGSASEYAFAVRHTADGGFVVANSSHSNDGDVTMNHGGGDCWVVKLDSLGNIVWERSLGGSKLDFGKSVFPTQDGGYIVAASSESMDGDVSANFGQVDYWMVKLDGMGNRVWEMNFGGPLNDTPSAVEQTADGGYIVAGTSNSNTLQVGGNHGSSDFWMVRLADTSMTTSVAGLWQQHAVSLYPNPVQDRLTVGLEPSARGSNVFVHDLAGRAVREQKNVVGHAATVDVATLPPGVYLLRVNSGSATASRRFVKE